MENIIAPLLSELKQPEVIKKNFVKIKRLEHIQQIVKKYQLKAQLIEEGKIRLSKVGKNTIDYSIASGMFDVLGKPDAPQMQYFITLYFTN